MIKAELEYNPYLNETLIKFNGNEPRINSLVEKHLNSKLQTWLKELPHIFHDEMNGYDFDFLFIGTELEFEEIKISFKNENVRDDEVKLIHINRLESRENKIQRIHQLLMWLKENRNNRFDLEKFFYEKNEIINGEYRYVVIHADLQNTSRLESNNTKVESIMDIDELKNTDLSSTPILFYINQDVLSILQEELKVMLVREDVEKEQLFFYIDKKLNKDIVERTLIDLDIHNPQIISKIDDDVVIKFLNVYPITDYIIAMIGLFRQTCSQIEQILEVESEKVAITNKSVHERIDLLDESMNQLKNALSHFENKDELYFADQYESLKGNIQRSLSKWRSRKTKCSSEQEAESYSTEIINNTVSWMNDFKNELNILENKLKDKIYTTRKEWYQLGNHELDYQTTIDLESSDIDLSIDKGLVNSLIQMKHEDWVIPDKGILAQIFGDTEVEEDPVLQHTWFMGEWKEHINKQIKPMVESYILDSMKRLNNYACALENDYKNCLKNMIERDEQEKDNLISQLSEEEKQLETDNNWLVEFKEQLIKIERE